MTFNARFTPAAGSPPDPADLLVRIDAETKQDAERARDQLVKAIQGPIPSRTGRTRASARGEVKRQRLGYTARAGFGMPGQTGDRAHVVRFLERGTGTRGGFGRIPKGKRGFIRGANVIPKGHGQKGQKVWTKGLKAAQQVRRDAIDQMRDAWERVTKEVGR